MVLAHVPEDLQAAAEEIEQWFNEDYLPTWVAAVANNADPSFITQYWGTPLWLSDSSGPMRLIAQEAELIGWMQASINRLHAAGYADTAVIDRRAFTFNQNSGAIDAIWSRRRADGSEIERLAVHFTIGRRTDGLRVIAVLAYTTNTNRLNDIWPVQTQGANCDALPYI
ncbi:hypothetical protein HPO96_05195 [Kribbella sandramycini]|uniref:DUF6841 domain-containing protein n=1 Tax=Kribbella sandramycini TaxID=60450 RepID=A0A7Y4NXN0_9ACTN|nr:hypothetical protein [Kribbella sandramycini]MBB6567768.1 hypothetical protein [Kribbella sandramycini]NOL39636.1 hypothetical protein [Kribbella sandramycini]